MFGTDSSRQADELEDTARKTRMRKSFGHTTQSPEFIQLSGATDFGHLSQGRRVDVQWPKRKLFVPKAISVDLGVGRFFVADEFGVYGAVIQGMEPSSSSRNLSIESFMPTPPCDVLEGQALQDISVICHKRATAKPVCRVLVLHSHGRRITDCPGEEDSVTTTEPSWNVSNTWLHSGAERIAAMSLDIACRVQDPVDPSVCEVSNRLVVGTNQGRLVQLRPHSSHAGELVPAWVVQRQPGSIMPGSVTTLPSGAIVVLRHELSALEAFASNGRWGGKGRLPCGRWYALCNAENELYLIGRLQGSRGLSLWRYALPSELSATLIDSHSEQPADWADLM